MFFEGAITKGYASEATDDAAMASIVAAGYATSRGMRKMLLLACPFLSHPRALIHHFLSVGADRAHRHVFRRVRQQVVLFLGQAVGASVPRVMGLAPLQHTQAS